MNWFLELSSDMQENRDRNAFKKWKLSVSSIWRPCLLTAAESEENFSFEPRLFSVKPLCTPLNVTIQNTQCPSWNVFVFFMKCILMNLSQFLRVFFGVFLFLKNLYFPFILTLLYKITLHRTKCDYSEYTMPSLESFSISRYLYTLAQNPWRCHIYSYIYR